MKDWDDCIDPQKDAAAPSPSEIEPPGATRAVISADFEPIAIRGEALSKTVLRDRR